MTEFLVPAATSLQTPTCLSCFLGIAPRRLLPQALSLTGSIMRSPDQGCWGWPWGSCRAPFTGAQPAQPQSAQPPPLSPLTFHRCLICRFTTASSSLGQTQEMYSQSEPASSPPWMAHHGVVPAWPLSPPQCFPFCSQPDCEGRLGSSRPHPAGLTTAPSLPHLQPHLLPQSLCTCSFPSPPCLHLCRTLSCSPLLRGARGSQPEPTEIWGQIIPLWWGLPRVLL